MNLPWIDIAVQTLLGSRVCGKTPNSENSNVIPIRATENSGKMLLCINMRCIVIYPKNTQAHKCKLCLMRYLDNLLDLGFKDSLGFIIYGLISSL